MRQETASKFFIKNKESPYTGVLLEGEYFGETKIDPQHPLYKEFEAKNYLKFKDALKLAKDSQIQDSLNPKALFAKDLLIEVADKLIDAGLFKEDEREKIKFYSALNTPLDFLHGVDAFLDIDGVTITLDATKNTQKGEHKADFIIKEFLEPGIPEEEKEFFEKLENLAIQIVNWYKEIKETKAKK